MKEKGPDEMANLPQAEHIRIKARFSSQSGVPMELGNSETFDNSRSFVFPSKLPPVNEKDSHVRYTAGTRENTMHPISHRSELT